MVWKFNSPVYQKWKCKDNRPSRSTEINPDKKRISSSTGSQYPTPILNIPEVVAFSHVITEDKSRVHDIKRV